AALPRCAAAAHPDAPRLPAPRAALGIRKRVGPLLSRTACVCNSRRTLDVTAFHHRGRKGRQGNAEEAWGRPCRAMLTSADGHCKAASPAPRLPLCAPSASFASSAVKGCHIASPHHLEAPPTR